jgi:uncharacterized protein DUF2695
MNMKSMSETLTPKSNRWEAFINALGSCRANQRLRRGQRYRQLPRRYRQAKRIMTEMGNVDIPASLVFFQNNGGHCDCEILLNVDRDAA